MRVKFEIDFEIVYGPNGDKITSICLDVPKHISNSIRESLESSGIDTPDGIWGRLNTLKIKYVPQK